MKLQETYRKQMIRYMGKFLDAQMERAMDSILPQKAYESALDIAEENKTLVALLEPVIMQLAQESGEAAFAFLSEDELKFEIDKALRDTVHDSLSRMSDAYNRDTLARLGDSLVEGIQNGENLDKLRKRVEEVYKEAKGYRAERVARYETMKGSNAATLQAYRQSGYVIGMRWLANPGSCEFCINMDRHTSSLDSAFLEIGQSVEGSDGGTYHVDYDKIMHPPLHPNCECTIVPVLAK